jgi:hypothetical protein
MEKVETYRRYVRQVLEHYAQFKPAYGDVEMELLFDPERDRYQLMTVGWNGYDHAVCNIDLMLIPRISPLRR